MKRSQSGRGTSPVGPSGPGGSAQARLNGSTPPGTAPGRGVPRRGTEHGAEVVVPGVVHSGGQMSTAEKASSGPVAAGIRPVTVIDRSRSCPQECAQAGEISCPLGHGGSSGRGRRSVLLSPPGRLRTALTCGDTSFAPDRATCPPAGLPGGWARPGDPAGRHRGHGVDTAGCRCTTVEMSTCRQQEDADRPQPANRLIRRLTCGNGPDPQLPHL
jgi:hypothetical protein